MNVLNNTKRFAKLRGLSIKEVGKRAHVSPAAIYRWDKSEPNASSVDAVAAVLGVESSELTNVDTSQDHKAPQTFNGLDLKAALLDNAPLYYGRRELDDIDRVALSRLLDR